MRLVNLAIGALAAAAAGAATAQTHRDIETSWGKAGVSLTQYRLDAGVCAAEAISLDVSATPAAKRMVLASRALDTAYSTAWMYNPSAAGGNYLGNPWHEVARVRGMYRVEENFEQVRGLQLTALADCLSGRGYRRFRLTDEQRRQVRRLPMGSQRRRAFLHGLASDADVLARQAL